MEGTHSDDRGRCRLIKPIRDHDGRVRFQEEPRILREVDDLDGHMFLVQFDDGSTTFVFLNEMAPPVPAGGSSRRE